MNIADDADRLQTLLYSAYDSDTVRDMERPLLDAGVPLMRMAASAAARRRQAADVPARARYRSRKRCTVVSANGRRHRRCP